MSALDFSSAPQNSPRLSPVADALAFLNWLVRGPVDLVALAFRSGMDKRDVSQLQGMDDRMLRDLGYARAELGGVPATPVWGPGEPRLFDADSRSRASIHRLDRR
jgi:uncharacterized protein YjiS (DUF1127 family)